MKFLPGKVRLETYDNTLTNVDIYFEGDWTGVVLAEFLQTMISEGFQDKHEPNLELDVYSQIQHHRERIGPKPFTGPEGRDRLSVSADRADAFLVAELVAPEKYNDAAYDFSALIVMGVRLSCCIPLSNKPDWHLEYLQEK